VGTTRTSLWLSHGSVTSSTMLHGGVGPVVHEVVVNARTVLYKTLFHLHPDSLPDEHPM